MITPRESGPKASSNVVNETLPCAELESASGLGFYGHFRTASIGSEGEGTNRF